MQEAAGKSRLVWILALLVVAAVAVGVRWQASAGSYVHPDEEMPEKVVGRILAEGTLDTNWGHTAISHDFHYNQFNFSSFHLTLAAVETLAGHRQQDIADPGALRAHGRRLSCMLSGLVIVLAGLLAWRLAADPLAAPLAALFTAANVQLFQDAIYARPETFMTSLTLLLLLTLTWRRVTPTAMLALSGLVVGVLIAAKVSFVLLLPFPALAAVARSLPDRAGALRPRHFHVAAAAYAGGLLLGFALGAPYAVAAPWQFLEGVSRLLHEYSDGWGPHGIPEGSVFQRLGYALRYLDYTIGWPLLLLAAGGLGFLLRRRDDVTCFAVAGPLLMLLYFSQTHAFFERNFSPALPLLFALAGVAVCILLRSAVRRMPALRGSRFAADTACTALAGVAALALAWTPLARSRTLYALTAGPIDYPKRIAAEQARVTAGGDVDVVDVGYGQPIEAPRDGLCRPLVYKVVDYGDPRTEAAIRDRLAGGWRRVGAVESPFSGSPTSTLWTYHAATIVFLQDAHADRGASCVAALTTLADDARLVAIEAPVAHDPAWTRNGYPQDLATRGWRFPLYASLSGNDAGTGTFTIGPFHACGEVTLPFVTGPEPAHTRLQIERIAGERRDVVYDGTGPSLHHWSALRLGVPDTCADWLVRASDDGTGWGQWIGLGAPVSLPAAAANGEASSGRH